VEIGDVSFMTARTTLVPERPKAELLRTTKPGKHEPMGEPAMKTGEPGRISLGAITQHAALSGLGSDRFM
jgi:hypothetical protein